MTNPDELKLIESCLQGNRVDFETLVKKYGNNVMALAVNITGNHDDALDAVQETFVQAYSNLDRFDRRRKFKTWLLGIAVKRCLDILRKRKSFLNYFLKHSNDFQEERERAYMKNKSLEDSELFLPLLKKIKEKERVAIVLKVNEGYSAREIGTVLNCSESTVRVHLFNARRRLKKLLAGEVSK
jgi:RNA polymerase sigma-70 factor (ECF subfamily)